MTPIPATHADHDLLAVAAFAAGDAQGVELDAALAVVAACPACADLHHDLRAIARAMPALPAPVRTRDFRLTPEQAASLRPAGWRRFLTPLAGPRFAFAGPLGTGLATLGIAGFLLAGSLGMPLAGTASAPGDRSTGGTGSGYESTSGVPAGAEEKALQAPVDLEQVPPGASSAPRVPGMPEDATPGDLVTQAGPGETVPAEAAPGSMPVPIGAGDGIPSVLPLLSGLVLAAGLALVVLRLAGRRLSAS